MYVKAFTLAIWRPLGRLGRLSFPRRHSALTPTSLIIGHHFSIWDFCNARKRLRRPLLGWENLAPRSASRDRSTGSANAWSVAAWSRSTVSFGVPFGAKSAHQVEKESFGSPSRRRSGCRAPGPRCDGAPAGRQDGASEQHQGVRPGRMGEQIGKDSEPIDETRRQRIRSAGGKTGARLAVTWLRPQRRSQEIGAWSPIASRRGSWRSCRCAWSIPWADEQS